MNEAFAKELQDNIDAICDRMGSDAVSVYESDSDQKVVRLLAWSGDKPREEASFDLPPLGTCAKTGKGILIEKKHEKPDKFQSIVIVPLEVQSELVGVLQCASTKSEYFKSDENLTNVRAVAEYLSRHWNGATTALH